MITIEDSLNKMLEILNNLKHIDNINLIKGKYYLEQKYHDIFDSIYLYIHS